MSRRAAMRYLVYGYIGERTRDNTTLVNPLHIDKSKHGFMFCIYDSEQEAPQDETAFPYGPSTPAIKDPRFKIEESSAGSMEFTLLCDGSSMVFYNPGTQGSSMAPRTGIYERLYNYMLPKQTEIVLYRSIKRTNGYETKELWSGRVDTIKKDFYNNWSIYCEGALSYFNDVALAELKLTNAINPQQIMMTLIEKHNQRISAIHTLHPNITVRLPNPSNPSVISIYQVPELPRAFNIGIINIDPLPAVATGSNMDNSFTISDGSTVWNNLTTMLNNYGGHFEVYKDKLKSDTLYIDWKKNGKYNEESDTYTWEGYHKFVTGTSQVIEFGKNLLDFSEEFDSSDLYTVLIPHGQATTSTVTDEEGNEKTVTGPALTVKDVNDGSIYVYDQKKVDTYGWIEKVESWNISEPNSLLAMAKAYYKDLRIGARSITIKAFDLKNLIYNTEAEPDQSKLLALDALYLYDVIKVNSMVHASRKRELGDDTQYMPIKGITIPLDKFPTDTEYVISNGMKKRDILSPGKAGEKPKETTPQPDVNPGDDPPTPNPEEEPTPTITPIGSVLGIDGNFVHYPPLYLDRKFSYIKSELGLGSGEMPFYVGTTDQMRVEELDGHGEMTVYYWGGYSWQTRAISEGVEFPKWASYTARFQPDEDGPVFETRFFKWSTNEYGYPPAVQEMVKQSGGWKTMYFGTFFGYAKEAAEIVSAESPNLVTSKPGAVFYTDDITNGLAAMRRRSDLENKTNYYEHVFDDTVDSGSHTVSELAPFVTGKANYYRTVSDANVDTTQTWFAHGGSKDTSSITWSEDVRYPNGQNVSVVINKIKQADCMGTDVRSILDAIGMDITADDIESNYLSLSMTYTTAAVGGNTYTIKRRFPTPYRPADLTEHKYYFSVGVLDLGDSAVLYYTYYAMDDTGTNVDDHTRAIRKKYLEGLFINYGLPKPTNLFPLQYFSNVDYHMEVGFTQGYPDTIAFCKDVTDEETGITYTVAVPPEGNPSGSIAEQNEYYTPPVGSRRTIIDSLLRQYGSQDNPDYTYKDDLKWRNVTRTNGLGEVIAKPNASNKVLDNFAYDCFKYLCYKSYWEADETIAKQTKILNKVKAKAAAVPFLVLTKTTSVDENAPDNLYGAFFCGINTSDNELTIEKPEGKTFYVFNNRKTVDIDKSQNGTPLMISRDTLHYTNYLFAENNAHDGIQVCNTHPVVTMEHTALKQAPIMCMAQCGGTQTSHVATNAFFPLCGDTASSKAIAPDCVWPQELTAPKTRGEVQLERDGDVNKIWYYGSDMKKLSFYQDVNRGDLTYATEDEIKKYFINTSTRQPLVIGGKNYIKVTPNLYLRVTSSND